MLIYDRKSQFCKAIILKLKKKKFSGKKKQQVPKKGKKKKKKEKEGSCLGFVFTAISFNSLEADFK